MTFISVCGLKKDWDSCFFSYCSCPSCYPSNYPEAVHSSCPPLLLSSPKPSHSIPLILTSTSMLFHFLFSCCVSVQQNFHIWSFLIRWSLIVCFLHKMPFSPYSALASPSLPFRRSTRRGQTACPMMHWTLAAAARRSWMKGGPGRALRFHRDRRHNFLSRPASSWLWRPALYSLLYKPYLNLQRRWSSLTQWVTKAVMSQPNHSPHRWLGNPEYIKSIVDVFCSAGPCFLGRRGQFWCLWECYTTETEPGGLCQSPAGEHNRLFNGSHSQQQRCPLWPR